MGSIAWTANLFFLVQYNQCVHFKMYRISFLDHLLSIHLAICFLSSPFLSHILSPFFFLLCGVGLSALPEKCSHNLSRWIILIFNCGNTASTQTVCVGPQKCSFASSTQQPASTVGRWRCTVVQLRLLFYFNWIYWYIVLSVFRVFFRRWQSDLQYVACVCRIRLFPVLPLGFGAVWRPALMRCDWVPGAFW